jgi:catechol 2,3-dioxygenase-like lactoylglutathione lyase family enzyme
MRQGRPPVTDVDLEAIKAERARLEATYITQGRPATSARGIHHAALICSNVEQTIRFYQGILEFPLTELFGNRDYKGSTHFFFDVGNGNLLAFFDFPGLDLGPYMETLGNINHIAISVTREKWEYLRGKLDAAGVEYQVASGTSIYFKDPDGVRLELLADPLGEMYGTKVLLSLMPRAEAVADAALGVDYGRAEGVELAAQVADVGFQDLGLPGVFPAPDVFE